MQAFKHTQHVYSYSGLLVSYLSLYICRYQTVYDFWITCACKHTAGMKLLSCTLVSDTECCHIIEIDCILKIISVFGTFGLVLPSVKGKVKYFVSTP